jgi:hypothetical protein
MKAKLEKGVFVPVDPLPSEWSEGMEVDVKLAEPAIEENDIDEWAAEMNRLCADSDPEEDRIVDDAIAEHRREAKEQARKEMGLDS